MAGGGLPALPGGDEGAGFADGETPGVFDAASHDEAINFSTKRKAE